MKIIAKNKKAVHDYEILAMYEAGLVLKGDEVKSVRQGSVSLVDSYATVYDNQINLINCYISPYSHSFLKSKSEPRRTIKLLMHRREINKLIGDVSRKGLTLIPLKMYINPRGFIKVKIGVAKHKSSVSKKRELKEKDIKRELARELKIRVK